MLLVVLFVLTFPGENRAADAERARATARADAYARDVIAPLTPDQTIAEPFDPEVAALLDRSVGSLVLVDPDVDVVRIWASDSTMMLWSSQRRDAVGSAAGLNDPEITTAATDPTSARSFVLDKDLGGLEVPPVFSAYAPYPVGGEIALAQFEVPESILLANVRTTWRGYRITAGVAVLFLFGLALGSLRDPVARIGAGVPFYPTSVPRDRDVIELDRRIELERAGQHARERVAAMEARLQESEEARRRLEGDLQRTMTELATRSPSVRPAIPRPEGPHPAPAVQAEPTPAVKAEPTPAVKAEPAPKPAAEPAAATARQATATPRRVKAAPTAEKAPRARRPAARTQVADGPTAAAPTPETEPTEPVWPPRERPQRPRLGEPVLLPESEVVSTTSEPDDDAVGVLERLVEQVGSPIHPGEDASALRRKLARTAALKKPGSRNEERLRDQGPEPPPGG